MTQPSFGTDLADALTGRGSSAYTLNDSQLAHARELVEQAFAMAVRSPTDRELATRSLLSLISPAMRPQTVEWASNLTEVESLLGSARAEFKQSMGDLVASSKLGTLYTPEAQTELGEHLSGKSVRGIIYALSVSKVHDSVDTTVARALHFDKGPPEDLSDFMTLASLSGAVMSGRHWAVRCKEFGLEVRNRVTRPLGETFDEVTRKRFSDIFEDSLFDCLIDFPKFVPFYVMRGLGLVAPDDEACARFDAAMDFSRSAFACWAFPERLIALDKPAHVTIDQDGRCTDLKWDDPEPPKVFVGNG